MTFASESILKTREQLQTLLVENPKTSNFYHPFRNMKKFENQSKVDLIQEEAESLIEDEVLPAYRKLEKYIFEEYINHLRSGPGVIHMRNGKEFYQACLNFYTTIPGMNPEYIHQMGLDQVKRLREGFVTDVTKKLGFPNNTFEGLLEAVRSMPDQQFDTVADMLKFCRDAIQNDINPKLSSIIEDEYLTDQLSKVYCKATGKGDPGLAFYKEPSRNGKRNGVVYIKVPNHLLVKFDLTHRNLFPFSMEVL